MMRHRWVLVLGVALPTVLLGWGWFSAARSERAASRRAVEAQAVRTADAVRGAVDESLEELRQRESDRPYYLYNYYYSPPDALALNDPVLVSPLAPAPADARLLGYFSIEPGGAVKTPHAQGGESPAKFAQPLMAALASDALSPLRGVPRGLEDNIIARGNDYVAQQALDIQSAVDGDLVANQKVIEQGRKNPVRLTTVTSEPMAWRTWGEHVVLQRVVRDELGVGVVQGVMLNRAHLVEAWLPHIMRRHAHDMATLVRPDDGTACAVRRPVSSVLPLAEIRFAALPPQDSGQPWQLGVLVGLVSIVFAGAYVVHRASQQAEALAQQKSRFVSTVTHELRTPLTTMRMHAEMLREGLVSPERQAKVHRELAEESVRLARLIDNVLELSRYEQGAQNRDVKLGDLSDCVARACEQQREVVESAGLVLELDIEDAIEAPIDEMAIERLVVNLLDNAVKYASDAEPPEVAVRLVRRGDRAVLTVRDFGPGIPTEEHAQVFERFYRVGEYAAAPGTGIGLSLVQNVAAAHGGAAEIVPSDVGCVVRVTLAGDSSTVDA